MNKDLKTIIENPSVLTMLNSLSEYIYITDDKGYVRFINHAAEKFEQQSNSEICGKHINDIYTQKESPTLKALSTCKTQLMSTRNSYMFNGKQTISWLNPYRFSAAANLSAPVLFKRDMTLVTANFNPTTAYAAKKSAKSQNKYQTLISYR